MSDLDEIRQHAVGSVFVAMATLSPKERAFALQCLNSAYCEACGLPAPPGGMLCDCQVVGEPAE